MTLKNILQTLLAKYPSLLTGDEDNEEGPRRWLLVKRETRVPMEEGGGRRWSLDHLFIDQEAVPTLVEVKRSTDTRIRREVVGQMLDYAANGVVYWPIDRLRSDFTERCVREGNDPDVVLRRVSVRMSIPRRSGSPSSRTSRSDECGSYSSRTKSPLSFVASSSS
jgi:hypothetical protein